MHRLQDKVVVFVGLKLLHEGFSDRVWSDTVIQEFGKIRPPLTEVVIYIKSRHSRGPSSFFETSELWCDRGCVAEHFLAIRKLEVVNDVDENQYGRRMMRSLGGWHSALYQGRQFTHRSTA